MHSYNLPGVKKTDEPLHVTSRLVIERPAGRNSGSAAFGTRLLL
jgi:hypothetical protein